MGWSLRRIGAHEQVGVSLEMVRKVLAAGPRVELPDDREPVTLTSSPPAVTEPPVGPVEFVGVDESGTYALFVDGAGQMTNTLALWRRTFDPPPVGGPGGLAVSWLHGRRGPGRSARGWLGAIAGQSALSRLNSQANRPGERLGTYWARCAGHLLKTASYLRFRRCAILGLKHRYRPIGLRDAELGLARHAW